MKYEDLNVQLLVLSVHVGFVEHGCVCMGGVYLFQVSESPALNN